MHSIHTDTTQVSHTHMANFPQQLSYLIIIHHLDKKSHNPIRLHALQAELAIHPDWTFVHQLIHDLQYGCDISYTRPQFSHYSNNLPSSFQHPSTLDNCWMQCWWYLGLFGTPSTLKFLMLWVRSSPQAWWCLAGDLLSFHTLRLQHQWLHWPRYIYTFLLFHWWRICNCISIRKGHPHGKNRPQKCLSPYSHTTWGLEPSWLPTEEPILYWHLPAIWP